MLNKKRSKKQSLNLMTYNTNQPTYHLADSFITQYQVRDIYVIECVAMAHVLQLALYKD